MIDLGALALCFPADCRHTWMMEWNSVSILALTSSTVLALLTTHSLSVSPLRLILEICSSSYASLAAVHSEPPAQL